MWFHIRLLEKCNLKCSSCYAKQRDRSEMMSFELYKDIIKSINEFQNPRKEPAVIYLSGGEPLLHPQFDEILDYAYTKFSGVTILTNGVLVKSKMKTFIPYRENLCVQVSV